MTNEWVHEIVLARGSSFCPVCGIKSFYVPRSHPDGYSINARCLDEATVRRLNVRQIDGRNWEQQYPAGRGEYA